MNNTSWLWIDYGTRDEERYFDYDALKKEIEEVREFYLEKDYGDYLEGRDFSILECKEIKTGI